MKPRTLSALMAGVGIFFFARPGACDQPFRIIWHGTGGWGNKSAYCILFDPQKVEIVIGTILSIDNVTPMPGMSEGVQLQLKTAKETIPVQLGPRWYIENQDIDLEPQDQVEVKGSRFSCNGQLVMSAAEVRKGDEVIQLRDAKGRPLWTAASPH